MIAEGYGAALGRTPPGAGTRPMSRADEPAAGMARPLDKLREDAKRRYLLRRFWTSALGFWRHGGSRIAWPLVIGMFVIILTNLAVDYSINRWHRAFFDALEQKNTSRVLAQAVIFPPLAAVSVLLGVLGVYVRMTTQRSWRAWLNDHVIQFWLAKGRYFQLNLLRGDHQNPEYRIADDLRVATDSPVDFAAGLTAAVLSAATFIVVLWTIGGSLSVQIGSLTIVVPGFLVIGAVVYAAVASTSMVIVGRRFVPVAENKNQAEASYRYVLTRLRENGESIALLGGEKEERAGLDRSFSAVLREWRNLCFQHMRTTVVSHTSGILSGVVPVLLATPKYIDGTMTLGQVMQAVSAFWIVQSAFGWIVDNYPRFADWTASARRVASLLVSLDLLGQAEASGVGYITQDGTDTAALRLCDLSVTLDDGTSVIRDTDVTIAPGERVLVVGDSGTGKSTLVRAIAGLWPWGGGKILYGYGSRLFLLPQRPYIPVGSLRRAAAYPTPPESVDPDVLREVLEAVGLRQFVERLDEEIAWDHVLSGGEKQRLAIARLLIHQPTIIVLDEATSALDQQSQEQMMKLISERLPEATIISVGHRPELEAFHERKLVMESQPSGARLVSDVHLTHAWPVKLPWTWSRGKRAVPAKP